MLVPSDKLMTYTYHSPGMSHDWQKAKEDDYYVVDLEYLYMLPGSELSFTVCTRSDDRSGALSGNNPGAKAFIMPSIIMRTT